jgi:metal-responsive CopG/Arc/MetJ family transcriptional regulator
MVLTSVIPLVILKAIKGGAQMPNVKTAISIEKPIFEQMDILAKDLNVSRSRLFAMAAKEFIQRHNNIELLKQINEAYEDSPDTESMVTRMHSNHFRMVKDQW